MGSIINNLPTKFWSNCSKLHAFWTAINCYYQQLSYNFFNKLHDFDERSRFL